MRRKQTPWVSIKGKNPGLASNRSGFGNGLLQDALVTTMDAVKDANGKVHRMVNGMAWSEFRYHLHSV